MKKNNLFTDVAPENREQMLRDIATKTNSEKVIRHYDEDEKTQMKDFVVENSISVKKQTEDFKAIQTEFNNAMKKYKEGINDALTQIDKGFSENEETVFCIADQEEGEMNVYDKRGEYLYSRKLMPAERQTKVLDLNQQSA